jgi:hypothetical protein
MSSQFWKFVNVSVRGSAHVTNGLPCQDWSAARLVGVKNDILICAISDGAGSAKFADEASRFIAEKAADHFVKQLNDHPTPEDLIAEYDRSDAEILIREQQNELARLASERGVGIQDFSATLLLGIIHPKHSFFIQIGDGCWCISRNGILSVITWPSQGEFVGQTDFVTSVNVAAATQTTRIKGGVDFIVGISDGLERLGLDMQSRVPYGGFFKPIVQKLISAPDVAVFDTDLRQFLQSDRVCERTDDDKTLLVAVKNGYSL